MYEASDDQLTGFASEASNLTGNGRRGDNELAELEAKISAEWETNDKIEQKARRGLRRRPDSGQYKRPGVRINVVKNPWTSPSSRHFPRKDIWEWSGAEDGENESFRKDFFKATQLQVSLNESSTQDLAAANSGIGDASQISGHDLTNIGSNQLRKAPSLRTSIHEQLMATADIRRAIRDGAKGKQKALKGDTVPGGENQGKKARRFSLVKNYRKKAAMEREKAAQAERKVAALASEKSNGYASRRDLDLERAPTPPLRALGLSEEATGDPEQDRVRLDAAPELLIAKHNASLTASTSQQVFVSACRKADIVPEPLLVPRKEPESTMEASKMHQNLNVRTKKDLLKLESRDVILWDWRAIAKGRTPDELRLEHFGMGDRYMPALAEALEADAKHALQGKRAFCRLQLAGCRISARGIKSLAPSLREHPRVIRIDLSRNALGPWAAEPLCAILAPSMPASCTLTALDLSHNGLGDLAIAHLFQALEHSVVEHLNLTKNEISSRGALEIASFLQRQRHPRYQTSTRRGNDPHAERTHHPSDLGATLSGGSPNGTSLLQKAGSRSFFDLEDAPSFASAMSGDETRPDGEILDEDSEDEDQTHHCPLSTLIIDWNRIQGSEAGQLLQTMTTNTVLREISLAWNGIGTHEPSMEAAKDMLRQSTILRKVNLAHNRIAASHCVAFLEQLPFNTSLLCLDLSGNEDHEVPFADESNEDKVAESWSAQAASIDGRSFIYSRYECLPCTRQQQRVEPDAEKHLASKEDVVASNNEEQTEANDVEQNPDSPSSSPSTSAAAAVAKEEEESSFGAKESTSQAEEVLDANVWKRRGVCWLERRWTPHTIWYYPGISGPPSSEVFLEIHLPGGGAMVTKMTFAPEMQSCAGAADHARTSRASMASSMRGTERNSVNKGPARSRQSTRMFAAQRTSGAHEGNSVLNGQRGRLLSKAQLRGRGNGSQIANSLESKAFQPCPPSGNGPGLSAPSRTSLMAPRAAPSMLAVSSQDRRTSMAKYDYRVLKAQALARPSNLSNALLQSIQTGGPLADVQEANSKKLLENACGLSLSQNEPVCPAFATLMLPPGRVYFKFIVRGREIFARDADTCWTLWPLHKHSELAARSWVVEKPASALRAQEFPTVANFVDLSWPGKPVGGLADPDPGSERPQPAPAWSIKRSLFRHHHCDNARKLAEAFNSDWERVLENHYVVKAGGDELPFIRELMWAHFADICTLFALHSCEGENNFALDFAEVKVWARSGDQPILPEHVSDEVLYEVYDKSALIEARHATNQFGRHYSFMVKRSGESVETDSGMLRHQLLQFLILLAGRVFSTVSLTSFVASHQDQEIARSQLRRVAPRRPSSLQSSFNQGSGAAGLPLHGSPLSLAARSQNSSQADQGHPEFGTPCFKSPFAAVHHLLQRALQKPGEPYIHRDVFRRGHMFFQDVVNVFAWRIDDLRRIFDAHSVKGHVLHDFIPSNSWEDIFHQIHPGYSKVPLRRMFVLSKSTFVDFDDVDFAPGLCFLEFLECLARLAHLDNLAVAVLQAFEEAGAGCSPCSLKETKAEDSLATRLELVINQLLDSFDRR